MNPPTIAGIAVGDRLPDLAFDASATRIVAGAVASRDYSPLHHDRSYAVDTANKRDIFANTQFQSALFERYVQDWTGPFGRVARMQFRMIASIFAGDAVTITGTVRERSETGPCGAAVTIEVGAWVDGAMVTGCEVLVALPARDGDNPWQRRGADWLSPA